MIIPNAGCRQVMDPKTEDNISEKDIIEFAIDIERQAVTPYSAAAETATDPKAKGLLQGLVAEEKGHESRLRHLLDSMTQTRQLTGQPEPSTYRAYKDLISTEPLPGAPTVDQITRFGIEREKATMELYQTFSHLLAAGAFSDLLEQLAQEERRHIARFEELMSQESRLRKP